MCILCTESTIVGATPSHFVVSLFVLTLPGGCETESFNLYVEGAVLTTAKEATLDVSFGGGLGLSFHLYSGDCSCVYFSCWVWVVFNFHAGSGWWWIVQKLTFHSSRV